MKQKTLNGRVRNVQIRPYLVDFNKEQGSEFSTTVLDFLQPYWADDVVLAEWPVVGTLMRYDFVNLTKHIVIETDGIQHDKYNPYFHGNRIGYLKQIKNDLLKDQIAELNGFKMVRIKPTDFPLSRRWFLDKFDVTL